jgi:hypothetical protein
MIHLLAHRLGLLCILDAQTGILAHLALLHYSPGPRQGPGYQHWSAARDASLSALEMALEVWS